MKEEGRRKKEEGRGKRKEGRRKKEGGAHFCELVVGASRSLLEPAFARRSDAPHRLPQVGARHCRAPISFFLLL